MNEKTPMECIECGHKFGKHLPRNAFECRCPKCGGYDVEVSYI